MKMLNTLEVLEVSGGAQNAEGNFDNPYTFTFIVNNTVSGAVIGIGFAIATQDPRAITFCAFVGATYATFMLAAYFADKYFFPLGQNVGTLTGEMTGV